LKYRNETRERHKPFGGLPKTKEKNLMAQGRRSREDKLLVTGLFLSNENTIGPAIDLLALVLREASRDRR